MPQYDATNGVGIFRLKVWEQSQSIALNQTTVAWELHLYCFNNISYDFSNSIGYNVKFDGGNVASGAYGYDFRGFNDALISSGTAIVTHNADGTRTLNTTGHSDGTGQAPGGPYDVGGSWALTPIPRATTPTVSPTSGNTGSLYTITHTPASSSFYHDIAYSLDGGGSYTNLATNVAGTTTTTPWTPAHTLLPNTDSVTAIIRVITRSSSGGTIIGTKTVNLPLTVPSSVVPTVSSVTWADAQVLAPNMPSLMGAAGRFVQGWSKLTPTVASAGAGGSTIVSSKVTQNGQITDSGVAFGSAIALSGAVPFSVAVTDSRGRNNAAYASTVAVTAYNFPNLPTPLVVRTSDAAGLLPSPSGTYLAINPSASVSSLNFSGEKNLLEYQVRTRPMPGGSWTTVQAWTSTGVSGTTWTTKKVLTGPYLANTEYEVEVSIRDLFGKNGYNTASTVVLKTVPIPTESVFMDWKRGLGIGLGKYHTQGILDMQGDVYASGDYYSGGVRLMRINELLIATGAEVITGTDNTKMVTPLGLQSLTATDTRKGIAEFATPAEVQTGTSTSLAVTPEGVAARALPWWEGTASASVNNTTVTSIGTIVRDAANSANDSSFFSVVAGKVRLQPGIYSFVCTISLPTTTNGRSFIDLAYGATVVIRQTWGDTEDTGSISGVIRIPSGTQDLTFQVFQTSGGTRVATSRVRLVRLSAP